MRVWRVGVRYFVQRWSTKVEVLHHIIPQIFLFFWGGGYFFFLSLTLSHFPSSACTQAESAELKAKRLHAKETRFAAKKKEDEAAKLVRDVADSLTHHFVFHDTGGVGAPTPHQYPCGSVASYPMNADVRTCR